MLRLRDSKITPEDYFWLCRRKRSKLSLSERKFFADAPLLMDFRRSTENNPEDNCEYYNRMLLRSLARQNQQPVVALDAFHEGVSQEELSLIHI